MTPRPTPPSSALSWPAHPGPARDAALLNAAAGLVAFDLDAVGPLADRMAAALKRAEESIESGAAAAVLDRWVALSQAV